MATWFMAKEVPISASRYLTAGKWYREEDDLDLHDKRAFCILDDVGEIVYATQFDCAHLEGGDWEVHEGRNPPSDEWQASAEDDTITITRFYVFKATRGRKFGYGDTEAEALDSLLYMDDV